MIGYRIEDMTCGGCVRAIRAAVARVAPQASVQADVASRSVRIDGSDDVDAIGAAIAEAGFHASPAEVALAGPTPRSGGCGGCGCGGG